MLLIRKRVLLATHFLFAAFSVQPLRRNRSLVHCGVFTFGIDHLMCPSIGRSQVWEVWTGEAKAILPPQMAGELGDIEGNLRKEGAPKFTLTSPSVNQMDDDSESDKDMVRKQPVPSTQRKPVPIVRKVKKHRLPVVPEMDVVNRKPKRGVPLPIDPRLMGYTEMMSQSAAGGWVEESDSEDCSDVFEEVHKIRMDPMFQIYLIVGIIVLVLAVVGSVRLHETIYGKPEIPENTFDFLRKDDNDEL